MYHIGMRVAPRDKREGYGDAVGIVIKKTLCLRPIILYCCVRYLDGNELWYGENELMTITPEEYISVLERELKAANEEIADLESHFQDVIED